VHSFYAMQGKRTHSGGWYSVATWAKSQVNHDPMPVKILKARAGEKFARIVAEFTKDGMRGIQDGRQVAVRSLRGKT